MEIRFAEVTDIDGILNLLEQVNFIHYEARPDILKQQSKYSREELEDMLSKQVERPILVAVEDDQVLGYMFGIYQEVMNNRLLQDEKSLYIDDICIDEKARGKHIGQQLYEATKALAKDTGCRRITLNVWAFNTSAKSFYERMGMETFKTTLEDIL